MKGNTSGKGGLTFSDEPLLQNYRLTCKKTTILDAAAKAKIKVLYEPWKPTRSTPPAVLAVVRNPTGGCPEAHKPNLTHKTRLEYTLFQALNTSAVGGADSCLRGIFSVRLLQSHAQYLRSSQRAFVTVQRLN